MSSFEVPGWKEFTERAQEVVDKWDEKKIVLLTKMANVYLSETIPFIPTNTDRLRMSFQVGVVTPDEAEIGTNVHYALYVNDGHIQHERLLPVKYISTKYQGKYRQVEVKREHFIHLRERFIPGSHFVEKGMTAAEPRMKTVIESWMEQIAREIEGGK